MSERPTKPCGQCGGTIEWRAGVDSRGRWAERKFCSPECRAASQRKERSEPVSAADAGDPPACSCHGEPMRWLRGGGKRAGGSWTCRVKSREASEAYKRRLRENPRKRCAACGESKPLDEFGTKAASKDGRNPRCKECVRSTQRPAAPPPRPEVCTHDGCSTRLSKYNGGDRCSLHALPQEIEDVSRELTALASKHRYRMSRPVVYPPSPANL